MTQVKATDQHSGEYGVYELDTLAESLTFYGMPADEAQGMKDLQAALQNNDYRAIEELSIRWAIDVEWV